MILFGFKYVQAKPNIVCWGLYHCLRLCTCIYWCQWYGLNGQYLRAVDNFLRNNSWPRENKSLRIVCLTDHSKYFTWNEIGQWQQMDSVVSEESTEALVVCTITKWTDRRSRIMIESSTHSVSVTAYSSFDCPTTGYVVADKGEGSSWWRHQMEIFSALLAICAGNSPVPGEFPAQRPVTRSFDVFFDLHPNKRLSKQWWGWWFETLSSPLWRHRNGLSNDRLMLLQIRERDPANTGLLTSKMTAALQNGRLVNDQCTNIWSNSIPPPRAAWDVSDFIGIQFHPRWL